MKSRGVDVNLVADYICWKFFKLNENISPAKLHKLLYFTQAWYLGEHGIALFDDDFEAWSHGPVCRAINDRFLGTPMALPISKKEIDLERLNSEMQRDLEKHISRVLEHFGELTFMQLEEFFLLNEVPWKNARQTESKVARSNSIISKEEMMEFHRKKS